MFSDPSALPLQSGSKQSKVALIDMVKGKYRRSFDIRKTFPSSFPLISASTPCYSAAAAAALKFLSCDSDDWGGWNRSDSPLELSTLPLDSSGSSSKPWWPNLFSACCF